MKPDTVRIWDLPTRLFHWGLLAGVLGLFATAYGPDSWIGWHPRLGYAVLTLLLFRLVWGFAGGHWSRFANFLSTAPSLLAYLRGQPGPTALPGHTPLGSLSILAMMAILLVQVGTGLISDDEIAFTGPLNRLVSTAQGLAATAWHKGWGQWLIVAWIALHVAAITFYRVVGRNDLIGPMLHGDKRLPGIIRASRDDARTRLLALLILAMCAGAVTWLVGPGPMV